MLKWLRIVFLAAPRVLYEYFFHILPYSRHPERYPIELRFHKISELVRFLLKVFRADLLVEGQTLHKELALSRRGLLVAPNHISDFDPLLLFAVSYRPLRPVAKKEVASYPIIGRAVKALDGLFMDREDLRQSLAVIKTVTAGLSEGKDYLIFPEGTRNRDPLHVDTLPFHPGTFKAALRSGSRVLPTSIYGTFRLFKIGHDDRRIPLEVKFHPVEEPLGMSDALASLVERKVASGVAAYREMDEAYYASGKEKIPLSKGDVR